jgi:hypothetical protein
MRPQRNASATISVREPTASARQIFCRWSLTVCGLRWILTEKVVRHRGDQA